MLRTRVITALVLLGGFLIVLFGLPGWATALAFMGIAAVAGWEWAGLMALERSARGLFVGVIVVSCSLLGFGFNGHYRELLLLSGMFWVLLIPIWLWRGWKITANDMAGYASGWLVIVPTWVALVVLHQRGPWILFAAMVLVWIADIAAYFAGKRFGRHKLAPTISPGKTWEGALGAVAGIFLYGAVLFYFFPGMLPFSLPQWMALLLLMTAVSIFGDLFESMIKRQAGVKDSGNLLPGHGGVLDRIDSQTSTLPLLALILGWALP